MILGFAHLMVNTDDITKEETLWNQRGYQRIAHHMDALNHSSKAAYTQTYTPLHDLMLLTGDGLWPLELTFHGPICCENRQINWQKSHLKITSPKVDAMRAFFVSGLGFKHNDQGDLRLESRLPGWGCEVLLEQGDVEPTRIDGSGATGLAFYVRRIAEEMENMRALGATDISGVFELTLGERAMKIVLMRAPGGPLIELIELDAKALRS